MSATDLLTLIMQVFFVVLGVVTTVDYFRRRGVVRLDIAILFWLFAFSYLLELIQALTGTPLPAWIVRLGTLTLLLEPYVLLRLVRYLRQVPPLVMRIVIIGMILSIGITLLVGTGAPTIVAMVIVAYVIFGNAYAMFAFVKGAFRTTGVVRQRLRFAAMASGLLAFALIVVEIAVVLPFLINVVPLLLQLSLIACAACFYVAFAPPRWIRRMWQFTELNRYLALISSKTVGERMDNARIMTELCEVANRAVNGMMAGVIQKDPTTQQWILRYQAGGFNASSLSAGGLLELVWMQNEPSAFRRSPQLSVADRRMLEDAGADTVLVVPILAEEHIWGLMVAFLRYGSLFIEDDLNLLTVLVRQSAISLENSSLIERLKDNAWEVEQSLRLSELLYDTSRTLLGVTGYDGIAGAVYDYASKHGATVATLSTIEVDENDEPEWANLVARVGPTSTIGAQVGARYYLPDLSYSKFWIAERDKVQLVENTLTDPRYDDAMKRLITNLGIHANVTLPLATDDGWIGVLGISWSEPHIFSALDRQFYNALATLVTQAMVNERLRVGEQQALKKLEAANRELEAFSYSVSHDLRSPLRAMDGFSQALEEDYADKLDDDGKNYLKRIRASSQRMGNLIDDLLELSRLSRTIFKAEQVDLSAMANRIADELRESEPERKITFEVAEGLTAKGDARLLHVVMTNLLSNAWKYTGKQPDPCIQFGMQEEDGKRVYYVRDNGAGFDMTFINKLFGVFQRLHDAHEFPGNGIGLATVQRIIHRHGGEIWAEGVVDQGATFYFTLT